MNPEFTAMRNIDRGRERHTELTPLMERACQRARAEVLTNPDYVIQEKDFIGVYDEMSVRNDIAYTERMQKKFDTEDTHQEATLNKIADTLEALVLTQSELNEWLGSNATVLKTSRFDDIENKVDMVVEWANPEEGSRMLALAVDVTFGKRRIEKKLTDIRHEIERGSLAASGISGTKRETSWVRVGMWRGR